jgi:hypothetical protein
VPTPETTRRKNETTKQSFYLQNRYDADFPVLKKKEFTTNDNQGNSNLGPICAVQPAEWTVPIKVTSLNAVRQALSPGQEIAGNLIVSKSFSEVQELRTLNGAHLAPLCL